MKLLFLLESRATWGYSKNVLDIMPNYKKLNGECIVTGSHLMRSHGQTINEIERSGHKIHYKLPIEQKDGKTGWSNQLGQSIIGYADILNRSKPDCVLLFGDRIETFGMACASAYAGIPIAHVQAGDVSGHIDDAARHAIGKFTHIHFASCEDSANRLLKMGEQQFRIHNVGAPQLDDIVKFNWKRKPHSLMLKPNDYIVFLHHPVMFNEDNINNEINEIFVALKKTGKKIVIIKPNNDRGHEILIRALENNSGPECVTIPNLHREEFLAVLSNAYALIGNSSCGLLEAPSLKIPVINLGDRQDMRPKASNIINCAIQNDKISIAIKKIENFDFKKKLSETINPYGNGKSAEKILDILSTTKIDKKLLQKRITY